MRENGNNQAKQNRPLLENETRNAPSRSFWEKPKSMCSYVTVEPVIALFVLAQFMSSLTIQNFNLEKACRVNLNFGKDVCDAMSSRNTSGFNSTQQVAVQKLVASVAMWKNAMQTVFPFIMLPFLGSWSDRHQCRRVCIILPALGEIVSCTLLLLCTYFFNEWPMEVNVFAESAPTSISGGMKCFLMGVYSYIGANSSNETRTLRIGVAHTVFKIGMTVGYGLSGVVYGFLGFFAVFSLTLCMHLAATLYSACAVKEKRTAAKPQSCVGFFVDYFDWKGVKDACFLVVKRRKGNVRIKIVLLTVLSMLKTGPIEGELNVLYLYTIYKFQWNEVDYSIYHTASCVASFIGKLQAVCTVVGRRLTHLPTTEYGCIYPSHSCAIAVTVFSKMWKWNDAILGVIATLSKISASFVFALAPTANIFFLGIFLDMFHETTVISIRSILAKLIPQEELGKANSILGMAEALMPVVYGPLYSSFYKMTIHVFPGSFLLLGAVLTAPATIIFLWLHYQMVADKQQGEEAEISHLQTDVQT